MTKRILALDLSVTNTGWAFQAGDGPISMGSQSFKIKPATRKAMTQEQILGEQCLMFAKWMREMLRDWNPDEVPVEKGFLNLNPSTEILMMIRGVLMLNTRYRDIDVFSYATSSLKAFALEPGYVKRYKDLSSAHKRKAIKLEMIEAAKAKGVDVKNDDEADSFWCLQLHKSKTQ
jgi:Holliday junction resolvasome RuvABC endonuclease subunit